MTAALSSRLPDFPWDTIAEARARASAHPEGLCDLSVGTPVDPVPQLAIDALAAAASGWAGYPATWGTPRLRRAIAAYHAGRWGTSGLADAEILPVIGTKELVAWLPTLLGLGAGEALAAGLPVFSAASMASRPMTQPAAMR